MKKLLALSLIVGLCSGCVYNLPKEQPRNVQEQKEEQQQSAKPQEQEQQQESAKPQEQEQQQESVKPQEQAKESDNKQQKLDASFIGEAKAKEIALTRAGVSASEVVFDRIELDHDDGIWEYEVEFRKGAVEYEVEVRADNGKVIGFDKDIDD